MRESRLFIHKKKRNIKNEKELRSEAGLKVSNVSLYLWLSCLENNKFRAVGRDPDMNALFSFERLQSVHLVILKMLKDCIVLILSSDSKLTNLSERRA